MALFYTIPTLIWLPFCNDPYLDFVNTKKVSSGSIPSNGIISSPDTRYGNVLDDLNVKILNQYLRYLGKD